MRLKNLVVGVVAAIGLIAGVSAASAQASLERILADGKIRVGTTGDFNPMTIRDPASGEYEGFEIDMAKQLAEDLGVELEFVPTDWKTMVAGVLADKYDIAMSGTSIAPGRAKVIGYTIPYTFNGTVPMALKTNDRFKSWEDADKPDVKVAVILGTVFEQQARASFPNAQIITVEPPATGYQEVLAGRADVTITSNVDAASVMTNFDAIGVFGDGQPRALRPLAYITHPSNQSLINFMNAWLELQKASGFIDGLKAKWGF